MKDDFLKHLYDIKEAVSAILRFVRGKTFKDTADVFGESPSRISHAQRMIESRELTQRARNACRLCKIKH